MLFKIIALIEMAVFYICYFTKMYVQKKKGIQTDQMGKGKTGFVKFIEVTLKIMTCCVPLVEIISIFAIQPMFLGHIRWVGAIIAWI